MDVATYEDDKKCLNFILCWLCISFYGELKVTHNVLEMGYVYTRTLLQLELDNFEISWLLILSKLFEFHLQTSSWFKGKSIISWTIANVTILE
jgi:hypothetical protein